MRLFKGEETVKLVNRFKIEGWGSANPAKGKVRTDSVEDIKKSVKGLAKTNPEIAKFAREMENMRPEHLGLAHDVIDLSEAQPRVAEYLDVDFRKMADDKQTIMGFILSKIPAVSRNNPEVLNLMQAVLDKTGQTNGKFFMANLFGRFNLETPMKNSEQIKAVSEVMDTIAESVDEIHPAIDPFFEKRSNFLNYILTLSSGDANPESIRRMPKIAKVINENAKASEPYVNIDIRTADPQRIDENLEVLPFIIENIENGSIKNPDVTNFLSKNVNLC